MSRRNGRGRSYLEARVNMKIEMDWGEMLAVFRAFQIAHPPIDDNGIVSPTIPLSDSEKTKVEAVADRMAAQSRA